MFINDNKQFKSLFHGAMIVIILMILFHFIVLLSNCNIINFNIPFSLSFSGKGIRISAMVFFLCYSLFYRERPLKKLTRYEKITEHVLIFITVILAIYIDSLHFLSPKPILVLNTIFYIFCLISFNNLKDIYPKLAFSIMSKVQKQDNKDKDHRFTLDSRPTKEPLGFSIPANNG